MAYIGNTVQTQGFAPAVDYFNGDGVTVTFTLSRPVASVAQLTAVIDNVIQNPSSAFTVSGNAITFTSAPLAGTNNIWVEYTSLVTTYAAISQDPSVIGDLTASGGYLSTGDFGNSYIDGTVVDYVTGNARITTGPIDDMTFYHGGTASRSEMMKLSYAGNSTLTGNLAISGQASLGTGQADYIAAVGGAGTGRVEVVGSNTNVNLALSTKGTGAVYFWRGGYGGNQMALVNQYGVGLGATTPSSGTGITFPTIQAPSDNANTLDDYEEGSWTPVWSGSSSGSGSPGGSTGTYTKIGRSVTITVSMNNAVPFITFSGTLQCSLPFPCGGGGQQFLGAPIYFYQGFQWNVSNITAGITPTTSSGNSYMSFMVMLVNGDRQTQLSSSNTSLSGGNNVYARYSMTYDTD